VHVPGDAAIDALENSPAEQATQVVLLLAPTAVE
jgi:hypothetical protein